MSLFAQSETMGVTGCFLLCLTLGKERQVNN